jgi:hypothetical protein
MFKNMCKNVSETGTLFPFEKCSLFFMCSFHDVHEMNAYRVDYVYLSGFPSVCPYDSLENRWTDLD